MPRLRRVSPRDPGWTRRRAGKEPVLAAAKIDFAEALAAHIAQFQPAEMVNCSPRIAATCTARSTIKRIFRRAVRAAGLPEGNTPHDLRQHFASVLLFAGESVIAVAELFWAMRTRLWCSRRTAI